MRDDYDLSELKSKKKKRVNSRTKGNTFERKVAAILNTRFNTDEFCRSPGSGAFATTHKLPDHLQIYGDLITPKSFKFIIECKKGYNKENLCGFFRENSEIRSFIRQALRDSIKSKKSFLVIFQQDRQQVLSIFKKEDFTYRLLDDYLKWSDYIITPLEQLIKFDNSSFHSTF